MARGDGLDPLRRNLGAFFSTGKRTREPKTIKVAVWPNGYRYVLRYRQGAWWWRSDRGSYPQSAAIEQVYESGGWIERHPNPNRPDNRKR